MTYDNTTSEAPQEMVKTILIIEDDSDITELIMEALKEEECYQFMIASDGLQALDAVKALVPDLFLLDYRLPYINGLMLYDYFQERDELKQVPLLLMSANAPRQEIERRHIYYLKKPFELDEMVKKVEEILAA